MNESKLTGQSLDIVAENVQKLKSLFPEIVTEDKIDFEKLQAVLGEYIDNDNERYNFTWYGKSKALRLAQTQSTGTLRPCKEESKDWDNTQNLYIEGDNLEVLKLLQKAYHNKIKMIYIDPCCGSGGMFVQSAEFIKRHKGNKKDITIYGQESNDKTYKLARMNLAIRGLNCDLGDMDASTFTSDKHPNLRADFILANEAVICGLTPEKARNFKEFAA